MITPPNGTPSFYAAILEKPAAEFLVSLLAPQFVRGGDIKEAMITSMDFNNDVEATVELQTAVKEIADNLIDFHQEIDTAERFNPLFLPKTKDLYDLVEVNDDGEITTIDGFQNPFVVMYSKTSIENHPNVIEGRVVYRQFALPPLHESLEAYQEPLLS